MRDDRKYEKFISDVLFNATYQVLLIILPIITMPILSRRLGTEGLGIYGYVFSIAQFLMILISVGMNPLRIRRIAQNKFNKDELNKEILESFYHASINWISDHNHIFFRNFFI